MDFVHACGREPLRGRFPSDCKAILTDLAHQFPKSRCELFTFAAKSFQPLNQLFCSNPLEKTTQSNSSHSPASTGKQLKQATNRPETGRKTGGRYGDADRKSYGSAKNHAGYRPRGRPRYAARTAHQQTRQAGRAFWRQIPDRRLRVVELPELRHPAHRGRHAIQGAFAACATCSAAGVSCVASSTSSSTSGPPSNASKCKLVSRHGGRGVPEPRHHPVDPARNTSSCWRATTSTRWTTRA